MNKKRLLTAFVLCGLLMLNVRTMPAPLVPEIIKQPFRPAGDPLAVALDDHNRQALLAARRLLKAILATDAEGKHPASDFTPSDKQIFLVWQDRTGSKGDQVQVRWIAEAADGLPKDRLLSEASETLPGVRLFRSSFYLSPTKVAFPAGTYRADLYKNAKLIRILKFTVKP